MAGMQGKGWCDAGGGEDHGKRVPDGRNTAPQVRVETSNDEAEYRRRAQGSGSSGLSILHGIGRHTTTRCPLECERDWRLTRTPTVEGLLCLLGD